ncbi:MAG: hypothetical protein AAFO75_14335, partial [Pseudomonadota bacterium]
DVSSLRVPYTAGQVALHAPLPDRIFVHVTHIAAREPGCDAFDLTVLASDGSVCADVSALTYKRVEPMVSGRAKRTAAMSHPTHATDIQLLSSQWEIEPSPVKSDVLPVHNGLIFGVSAKAHQPANRPVNQVEFDVVHVQVSPSFHFNAAQSSSMDISRSDHFSYLWQCLDTVERRPDAVGLDVDALIATASRTSSPGKTDHATETQKLGAVVSVLREVCKAFAPSSPCRLVIVTKSAVRASAL